MPCDTYWPLYYECSGRGRCVNDTCVCDPGWSGKGLALDFIDENGDNMACYSTEIGVIVMYSIAIAIGVLPVIVGIYRLLSLMPFSWRDIFTTDTNHSALLAIIGTNIMTTMAQALIVGGKRTTQNISVVIFLIFGIMLHHVFLFIMSTRLLKVVSRLGSFVRYKHELFYVRLLEYFANLSALCVSVAMPTAVYFIKGYHFRYLVMGVSGFMYLANFLPKSVIAFIFARRIIKGLEEGALVTGNMDHVKPIVNKLNQLRSAIIIPIVVMTITTILIVIFFVLADYVFFIGSVAYSAASLGILREVLKKNSNYDEPEEDTAQ